MIVWRVWPTFLLFGTTAFAANLPLKLGTYVLAGVPCTDPPLAAMFTYDGSHFSYPHATKCESVVGAHSGSAYHVQETCSALGDGTAAAPTTTETTYTILSDVLVQVSRAKASDRSSYRWCPAP